MIICGHDYDYLMKDEYDYNYYYDNAAGPNDDGGLHDDQLSALGRYSELLPIHHFQPGPDR